jgi:hypothetical protein
MLVTVGIVTTRTGHKVHRHVNGWAACGAGKLIQTPRFVSEGDQLCRRCSTHLHASIEQELDNLRRRNYHSRADMLDKFLDSAASAAELEERKNFFANLHANLQASWSPKETRLVAYADDDAPTLF